MMNVSCCGAIDNAVTLHVGDLGFDSHQSNVFSFFNGRFVLFCEKRIFIF